MAIDLFSKKLDQFEKSIELRTERNSMIATNIAKRETPGYRTKNLVFEKELRQAYQIHTPDFTRCYAQWAKQVMLVLH